jgi:metal-responsive CopG/Arc/MetJ family transcriptional regulator
MKGRDNMTNKKKITYSIDKNILELFDKFCNQNAINKSKYVENLIKRDLQQKNLKGENH